MKEKSNGELFIETGKWKGLSVLIYRKPTHTDQYPHYSSHPQLSCKESVVSSLLNKVYNIVTNKDNLYKENARIKH